MAVTDYNPINESTKAQIKKFCSKYKTQVSELDARLNQFEMFQQKLVENFSDTEFQHRLLNLKRFYALWLSMKSKTLLLHYGIKIVPAKKFYNIIFNGFEYTPFNNNPKSNPKFKSQPSGMLLGSSYHALLDLLGHHEVSLINFHYLLHIKMLSCCKHDAMRGWEDLVNEVQPVLNSGLNSFNRSMGILSKSGKIVESLYAQGLPSEDKPEDFVFLSVQFNMGNMTNYDPKQKPTLKFKTSDPKNAAETLIETHRVTGHDNDPPMDVMGCKMVQNKTKSRKNNVVESDNDDEESKNDDSLVDEYCILRYTVFF
jgi:hypothetical protein